MASIKTTQRPLHVIADDIRTHWQKVNYAAVPYLDAMRRLDKITDMYFADTAKSIVLYFLCNAGSWRGEDARRIKKELKSMAWNQLKNNVAQVSDFAITGMEESVIILWPQTPEGEAWITEYVADDHMGWCENAIAIEPRYIEDIINGIHDSELTIKDLIDTRASK